MSDIDENLSSILSSLIDADGIETSHSVDLVDSNGLHYGNLANCITGNDASLHQTSDENVSTLLETHLNQLSRSVTASIVDTTADVLHDVSEFDLDKPIESLLESTPSDFISHAECVHGPLSIDHKSAVLADVTGDLIPLHSDALNDLGHIQSVLDVCNHHVVEICTDFIPTDLVVHRHTFSTQNYTLNDRSMTISLDGIVINGELQDVIEADDIICNTIECNPPYSEEIASQLLENGEKEVIDLIPEEVIAPLEAAVVEENAIEPNAIELNAIEENAIEPNAIEATVVGTAVVDPSAIELNTIEPNAIEAVKLAAVEEEKVIENANKENRETIVADQVINDEQTTDANKKRRRILVYNDGISDNSELEAEREKLPKSKSPTPQREIPSIENQSQPSNAEHSNTNTVNEDQIGGHNESTETNGEHADGEYAEVGYIRDPDEKPGPKSKKQSTYLYNALKAKALLESAIVIPARKRKKRVFDSDDEFNESTLNQPIDSVDDIGLITEDNHLMPLNVTIETEQKLLFVSERRPFEFSTRKVSRTKDGYGKDSLSRSTTQAKMEKYHAHHRRGRKKKESKDYFDMPLNAPYVDTSSDEDYFVPHESHKKSMHHHHSHSHHWHKNGHGSSSHHRRKKGHIPDEIYFNSTVPLHVLYSYDDSSSDEDRKGRSHKSLFSSSTRKLNKMPPVHKIIPRLSHRRSSPMHKIIPKHVPKQSDRGIKFPKPVSKPTVFEQLDKLKRMLRATTIKININELLKGSKTFQERCERIRNFLQDRGIEGEPTMAKCKQLKKQLKLEEEAAGLDPSVIIQTNDGDDGRPKRATRTATRRNYVYNENNATKLSDQPTTIRSCSTAAELLQNIKEFIDSDSEFEIVEHSQNGNHNNNHCSSDSVDFVNSTETVTVPNGQNGISESSPVQENNAEQPSTENINPTQVNTDNHHLAQTSEPAQCTTSLDQV